MKIRTTTIPEVRILEPSLFPDKRGWFMETFNADVFRRHELPVEFAQDNLSHSHRNVLRGLHYQLDPPQGKLVRCLRGAIFDVAVDIRRGSAHFGKWTGVELTSENHLALWIPPGFAHGFAVLSDEAGVTYKCTTLWNPKTEHTIVWNDPEIGIEWPVAKPVLSTKDRAGSLLRDAVLPTP